MTDEQKSKLEAIGFAFELPDDMKAPPSVDWDVAYAALQDYHKEHGDCQVPQATIVTAGADGTEIKLGKWVQRQRQVYKNT